MSHDLRDFIADHPGKTIRVNADGTLSAIDPVIPAPAIPDVTAWQLTQALIEMDMISAVESLVATTNDPLIKYGWHKATTYSRRDPVVLAAQAGLGMTDAQVDALFILAAGK